MEKILRWARWPRPDFNKCLWCLTWKKHTEAQHDASVKAEDELRNYVIPS